MLPRSVLGKEFRGVDVSLSATFEIPGQEIYSLQLTLLIPDMFPKLHTFPFLP